ncbi:CRISPR-associated protein Csx19 [Herpetosiphon gulosus]|uniref:TIGR03984 family CRISPR-associated protein n=1 Tax=Herpetosiphon gulosus TaxID=1973496 RepID=A0ABP9X467_9CHLR
MFETLSIDQHSNLIEWLKTQAERYNCQWLLAHSLDCVIWGKFEQSKLLLGCDSAKLNFETLQQCRIFGLAAEVSLWHNGSNWQATVIKDPTDPTDPTDPAESDNYIDEYQMLWGTKIPDPAEQEFAPPPGFTTLADGIQGMQHTLPLVFEPQERYFGPIIVKNATQQPNHRPARLLVRHILDFDPNTGAAYIRASRLVELSAKEIEHGNRS